MLIVLSQRFEEFASAADWDPYVDAIENLINAQVNGNHILLPPRNVLRNLIDLGVFSQRQTASLRDVETKYSTLASGLHTVAILVRAVREDEPLTPGTGRDIVVRLNLFRDPAACERCELLVENAARDGRFYQHLCGMLAKDAGFAFDPKVAVVTGGGSGIAEEFDRRCTQGQPTICVVDSDRCTPFSPDGQVAKAVKKVYVKHTPPIGRVHVLSVRAVENLVPLSVYNDVYANARDMQNAIDVLSRLGNRQRWPTGHEYLRFVNYKEGYCAGMIRRQSEDALVYLIGMWKTARPEHAGRSLDDIENEEETLVPGLSRNAIQKVNEQLERPACRRHMRGQCLKSWMMAEYVELVRLILAFCACLRRLRA